MEGMVEATAEAIKGDMEVAMEVVITEVTTEVDITEAADGVANAVLLKKSRQSQLPSPISLLI